MSSILWSMQLSEVAILALVQGLTEFLPVSSSGHLLVARFFFGISDAGGTTLDAFLHLGTLVAVLVYYWQVWLGIARGIVRDDGEGRDKRELLAKLAVATVPAAIVGYFFQGFVAAYFRSPVLLSGSLLFTAAVLGILDHLSRKTIPLARADYRDAAYIGLMQVLALIPGVSRSGMTIAAGRWRGLSRKQATTFSFLMSAPIIAGAGLSSLADLLENNMLPASHMLVGFGLSFVSGLLAIYLLLKIVERMSFTPFVIYLVGLAAVLFLYVG